MALNVFQLRQLAQAFSAFAGQRVGKILQYGKDVFSFRLQKAGVVYIVLDNQNPMLFLGKEDAGKTSLSTTASALLRKRLSGAEFAGAELLNDDRVIELRFNTLNDIFEEEPLSLVLELIPTKANMAVLNKNRTILYAFRANSITDERPIFHGITYEPPLKKGDVVFQEEPFDIEAYFTSCHQVLSKMQQQRKANLYQGFFRDLRAKIKGLKRKIAQIEADIEKGKKHLGDADYGNYIYTFGENIHLGDTSFDYYGETVPLDPLKGPHENAAEFFRRAKKAKNAIALGEQNKKAAEEELLRLQHLLDFALTCDEEALASLQEKPQKPGKNAAKARQKPKTKGPIPYIAHIGNTHFYFGRTAKQNDALTFTYATKGSYLWFHVKDQVGAHVILPLDEPSDAQIQQACELALLASGKSDGEVQFTAHKNIRKGAVPGLAILSTYRSTTIKSISDEVVLAYEKAIAEGSAQ